MDVGPVGFPGEFAAPDAPFKKNWHELAMKRMLRWAAENGYDRVAWTTGDQQSKRYGKLLEGVKTVHYNASVLGNGRVAVTFADGGSRVIKDGVSQEDLATVVGKDIAQKLLSTQPDEVGNREASGENLTIGGEGMKGFYDKILPDFMNKYGKKWGARVGETEIGFGTDNNAKRNALYDAAVKMFPKETKGMGFRAVEDDFIGRNPAIRTLVEQKVKQDMKVHSIDVTPEMKKSVLYEGQPISEMRRPASLRTAHPPSARPDIMLA